MTALPGWPAVSGAATFQHIRRALAGQVVRSAAGVLRKGILPTHTGPLVTGTETMNVAVAPFVAVLDRNGAIFLANDGTVNVLLSSAPASGSRWSVVYVKQQEMDAPFSDPENGPVIDKVESTSSAAAARANLPDGALELALVKVDAGSATTDAVGVTISQTAPFTAMTGGSVPLRSQAEQDAWAPHDGSTAYRIDTGARLSRVAGAWVPTDAYATAEGFVYVSATAGVTVSFPAGRFTQAPLVFATPQDPSLVLVPHISDRTATSFRLRVYTLAGAATTANCAWMARQRTPTGVGG